MKKIFAFFFFMTFPLVAFAQPDIVFEQETHDFGSVAQGELLEYTFSFTNKGTEDLFIEKVASS